jgi:hypothetical protein
MRCTTRHCIAAARNAIDNYTAHDPDYRNSLKDFTSFLEKLSEKVIEADETIPELPVKDIVRVTSDTL